jgi:hypothetical protein
VDKCFKFFALVLCSLTVSSLLAGQNSEPLGELARKAREARERGAAATTTVTNDSVAPPASVPSTPPLKDGPKSGQTGNYVLKKVPKNWPSCAAAVADLNGKEAADTDVHFDPSLSGNSVESKSGWTFTGTTSVKRIITVILPEWVNIPNDPAIRAAWQNVQDGLLQHEQGHVRIAIETSRRLDGTSISATGSSAASARQQAQQQFNQMLASVQNAHLANQQQYDAQTDHGRKQSAVGGIDIKFNCP